MQLGIGPPGGGRFAGKGGCHLSLCRRASLKKVDVTLRGSSVVEENRNVPFIVFFEHSAGK
jgi:hypothetical protein